MVAAGGRIAAAEGGATFGSTALNVGGNALIKGTQLASQATTFKGALAVGTTYGYGGEAINSLTTGKQFSFGDATSKAVGMSAALYGAGRTGGLGHWKGSLVYGGVRTVEEQGRAVVHGKDIGQAAMDSLGSFGEHSTQAFAIGTFANMNAAAQAGRFTMARALPEGQALSWNSARQFAVNLPGATGSNLLSQGRLVFGEGMGLTPKSGLVLGTAATGLFGWQVHQSDAAYADSRTAKEWDDKDQMTRMRMNQAMEQLSKPVARPTIKRPQQ
jgi:hypothetical protein